MNKKMSCINNEPLKVLKFAVGYVSHKIVQSENPLTKEIYNALKDYILNDENGIDSFLDRLSTPELKSLFAPRLRQELQSELTNIFLGLRQLEKEPHSIERDQKINGLLTQKMRIDKWLRQHLEKKN